MGDFGNGIDMQNNMLGEMKSYNSEIAEHKRQRNVVQNNLIEGAKQEISGVADPEKLGSTAAILGSAAEGVISAKGVLRDTYGGNKMTYAKNLGRTGDESSFGLKSIYNKFKGVTSSKPTLDEGGPVQGPSTKPVFRQAGQYETSNTGALSTTDGVGGLRPVQHFQLDEPSATPDPKGIVSGGEAPIETNASQVSRNLAAGAAETEPSLLRTAGGIAGDIVGKAGLGLGILTGGEALMTDIMGGKVQGDDKGEKTGNELSVAGAALDTLGLAIPPLAILGGIAGVASAIFSGEGHIKHAQEVDAAAKKAKTTPGETPMQVTSMASLGQIASRGTDVHSSIAGSSAF